MALIDRIEQVGAEPYMTAVAFTGCINMYALGQWTAGTARDALNVHLTKMNNGEPYALDPAEQADLVSIKNHYDNDVVDHEGWRDTVYTATALLQDGLMTRGEYQSIIFGAAGAGSVFVGGCKDDDD